MVGLTSLAFLALQTPTMSAPNLKRVDGILAILHRDLSAATMISLSRDSLALTLLESMITPSSQEELQESVSPVLLPATTENLLNSLVEAHPNLDPPNPAERGSPLFPSLLSTLQPSLTVIWNSTMVWVMDPPASISHPAQGVVLTLRTLNVVELRTSPLSILLPVKPTLLPLVRLLAALASAPLDSTAVLHLPLNTHLLPMPRLHP